MLLGTNYISDLFPTGVWELHLMSYIRGYGSYMCNRYITPFVLNTSKEYAKRKKVLKNYEIKLESIGSP